MNTVLIILGLLGLVAIVISAYALSVTTRSDVRDDDSYPGGGSRFFARGTTVLRRPGERRSGRKADFPLVLDGTLISEDRRTLPDRRKNPQQLPG